MGQVVGFHRFPGTKLYNRLKEKKKLLYDKWWLDHRYKYGQVPYTSSLDPVMIERECIKSRKSFYSISSILYRMTSLTNIGNLYMLKIFLFINLLMRKEATQRINYPLGDLSHGEKSLKKPV